MSNVPSIYKKALRCLGVAESFIRRVGEKSILAGVVMRGDLLIDGVAFARATVGGMDATEAVEAIYERLARTDINLIMLNGCVISWYNVIDLPRIHEETGRPVICVTYEESAGLERFFRKYFQDYRERIKVYRRNGGRIPVPLKTGYVVYVRAFGLNMREAAVVLNRFTVQGKVPEPLRVARLIARNALKHLF